MSENQHDNPGVTIYFNRNPSATAPLATWEQHCIHPSTSPQIKALGPYVIEPAPGRNPDFLLRQPGSSVPDLRIKPGDGLVIPGKITVHNFSEPNTPPSPRRFSHP